MKPELTRPVRLAQIGAEGCDVEVRADAGECAALAKRFGLPAVKALSCRFHLTLAADGAVTAEGRLQARVVQTCVVSLEGFEAMVTERFALRFVRGAPTDDLTDIDAPDEIPFSGDSIDLGEAAAEQLALALDPYPRKPGVMLDVTAAADDDAAAPARHAFAVLATRHQRH